MQLTTAVGRELVALHDRLHQLGGRVEDVLGVVALDADCAAQGEESHWRRLCQSVSTGRSQRAQALRLGVGEAPVRAGLEVSERAAGRRRCA